MSDELSSPVVGATGAATKKGIPMSEQVPVQRGQQEPTPYRPEGPGEWQEPFRELATLWERMGQLFGPGLFGPGTSTTGTWQPTVDVEETDKAYRFDVDLPGMDRDDITVEVHDRDLWISGEVTERERTGILRHQTRRSGMFRYRSTLPPGADTENVEARLDKGVLTVTIPKTEHAKPRTIKIK